MKKIILLLSLIAIFLTGCTPSPIGPGEAFISPALTNSVIALEILTPGNYNGVYQYGYAVKNITGYGDTQIENLYIPGYVEMNITKLDPVSSILKLNVSTRRYYDNGEVRNDILLTGETTAPGGNVTIKGNI